METVVDLFGRNIEFSGDRWNHACQQHPEISELRDYVIEAIEQPDFIKISLSDKSVCLYYKFYQNVMKGKYILAVVKTNKRNFLITAYVTDYIKAGEDLWKRKN